MYHSYAPYLTGHRTYSDPMTSKKIMSLFADTLLIGSRFPRFQLWTLSRNSPWNDQQFRRRLPQARSSRDYEAKTTTVFVFNNNNLMSWHTGKIFPVLFDIYGSTIVGDPRWTCEQLSSSRVLHKFPKMQKSISNTSQWTFGVQNETIHEPSFKTPWLTNCSKLNFSRRCVSVRRHGFEADIKVGWSVLPYDLMQAYMETVAYIWDQ